MTQGAVHTCDGERAEECVADLGVTDSRREQGDEGARREPIEAREPGAVGDSDAAERNRGGGEGRSHDSRARRRRALVSVERSELLEHQLGREVVALAAHEADDCGEWLREISGERKALGRERADASGSADRDTFRLESAAEERSRRERGLRRRSSSKPAPRDDERGERR